MKVLCVIPARYASTRLPGKAFGTYCRKAYDTTCLYESL